MRFRRVLLGCVGFPAEIMGKKKVVMEKFELETRVPKIPDSTCGCCFIWKFNIRTGAIFVFILESLGLTSQLYRTMETYLLVSHCR